jgi:hypothetical protein
MKRVYVNLWLLTSNGNRGFKKLPSNTYNRLRKTLRYDEISMYENYLSLSSSVEEADPVLNLGFTPVDMNVPK